MFNNNNNNNNIIINNKNYMNLSSKKFRSNGMGLSALKRMGNMWSDSMSIACSKRHASFALTRGFGIFVGVVQCCK
eukprot:4444041-Amphidinium_carterae.1